MMARDACHPTNSGVCRPREYPRTTMGLQLVQGPPHPPPAGITVEFLDPGCGVRRSATFLPEVAAHEGWDHQQTLSPLVRKVGGVGGGPEARPAAPHGQSALGA